MDFNCLRERESRRERGGFIFYAEGGGGLAGMLVEADMLVVFQWLLDRYRGRGMWIMCK